MVKLYAILLILVISQFAANIALSADMSLKIGRPFSFDGINCHSASLQAAGVTKYPSHVTDQEIQFYFRTQCKQVSNNRAGAIGITGMGTAFSHSFYYIQPNKVFQKKSLDKKTSYQLLKGGPVQSAKYFVCQKEASDECSDQRVTRLEVATEKLGRYFAAFMLSADDMKLRDLRHNQLIQVQKWTNSLRDLPNECRNSVQRLALRQDSLRAATDRLSGARFFLGLIPKSVGRD